MASIVRCGAGILPFGGHDKRCTITAIQMIPTDVTADTATELVVADANFKETDYQDSKDLKQVFHYKGSVDDGVHFFSFDRPLRCDKGIRTINNTNCRPAYYIE